MKFSPKHLCVCALAASMACIGNAAAELVRVEWVNHQCGAFVVKTAVGYAYAQKISPGMVSEGDTLDGDFERDARPQEVMNTTSRGRLTVWVEKFANDKRAVLERVPANCAPEEALLK